MRHPSQPNFLETGRSPHGQDGRQGLPRIGSSAQLITGQITEKFRDDSLAVTANTAMVFAIAARAHYADKDWRDDSRTLDQVPVQEIYLRSLGLLVLASWEQSTDTNEHEITVFHEIFDAMALKLSDDFSPHELAIFLTSSYAVRQQQYDEHLNSKRSNKPNITKITNRQTPLRVLPKQVAKRTAVPNVDVHTLDDAALFDIALDFIIEDIAWESLQKMLKPVWDRAVANRRDPKFPTKRLISDVLVKFVTQDNYWAFLRHPVHSKEEPAKTRIRYTRWIFEAAEKKRTELHGVKILKKVNGNTKTP